jgi:hypothetical protein
VWDAAVDAVLAIGLFARPTSAVDAAQAFTQLAHGQTAATAL